MQRRRTLRTAAPVIAMVGVVLLASWYSWPTAAPQFKPGVDVDYCYGDIACHEVVHRLGDLATGNVDATTRSKMEEHLRQCAKCRQVQTQLDGQIQVTPSLGAVAWQSRAHAP